MDCTPNCWKSSWFASTSILARTNRPAYSAASRSSSGLSCLQGSHHSAQKSMTTGTSAERCSTSCSKPASSTSKIKRAAPAAPASPPPRAASARVCSAFCFASPAAFTAARSTTPLMDIFRGCMGLSSPLREAIGKASCAMHGPGPPVTPRRVAGHTAEHGPKVLEGPEGPDRRRVPTRGARGCRSFATPRSVTGTIRRTTGPLRDLTHGYRSLGKRATRR